jgi:heterodisulfide reductase subunit C
MISNIIFLSFLVLGILLFLRSLQRIIRNIKLGTKSEVYKNVPLRIKNLLLIAIGQSKMTKRPIAGILHIFIYIGFILVNIELIEIMYDGITGSHRVLNFLPVYSWLISILEILAVLVILACLVFLFRRNILKIKRFHSSEMTRWPRLDANIILITEILLMLAFLTMNAADLHLQTLKAANYRETSIFLISGLFGTSFHGLNLNQLVFIERFCWWFHVIGIIAFLNYVPYSKHFHIILAFPNVYYSRLKPLTYIANMESVTREVKIAMGLIKETADTSNEVLAFGANDVGHLSRKSLMDAYSCTECGRCTMVCPANLTGKKLSPRKIIMETRDRLEEFGIKKNPENINVKKSLLRNYISEEEIWACTTCNACTYECPVNIDPVKIIIELRRYLFMEESAAPATINTMCVNIENNGAPWQYPAADRDNWTKELYLNK